MKSPGLSVVLMCGLAATAHAAMPPFNAECPAGLSVHADARGSVYVNGKAAQLKRFNDNYVEARDAERGVTVSIARAPDGAMSVSYTGPGRTNGVCEVTPDGGGEVGDK